VDNIRQKGAPQPTQADEAVPDKAMFKVKEAEALRTKARQRARQDDVTDDLRSYILSTLDAIDNAKTDMELRRSIFEEAIDSADSVQPGGRAIVMEALEGFAYLHFTRARKAAPKAPTGEDVPF
jgi:hypothetical protein